MYPYFAPVLSGHQVTTPCVYNIDQNCIQTPKEDWLSNAGSIKAPIVKTYASCL